MSNTSPLRYSLAVQVSYHLFLLLAVLVTLFPFAWMVGTSFKPQSEICTRTPTLLPAEPTLEHFRGLLEAASLGRGFLNSLIFAVGVTVLSLLVNALAAYAFARLRFPGRERLFALLLVTMMVPGQVTMMPVFLILKTLGWLNSWTGLIVPGISSVFAIFLLRQFMSEIPEEILESARIDGCTEFQTFWNVVLPLCLPALATLAIFNFIGAWNDFLWPLIIMLREDMQTLPVMLANLNGQYNTDWGLLMAGAVVVVTPVIIVFLFAQRYYIEGIAAGAVKE